MSCSVSGDVRDKAASGSPAGKETGPPQAQNPESPFTHAGLSFTLIPRHTTSWTPACLPRPTLSLSLDACIVPSPASPDGARLAASNVLVLDDFVDEATRAGLLEAMIGPAAAVDLAAGRLSRPPAGSWERRTTDAAGGAPSWGMRGTALRALRRGTLGALREVGARLAALYPDAHVAWLPSDAIQGGAGGALVSAAAHGGDDGATETCWPEECNQGNASAAKRAKIGPEAADGATRCPPDGATPQGPYATDPCAPDSSAGEAPAATTAPAADCVPLLANAAVAGDEFAYHQDADPTSFPDSSPWVAALGDYFNGEPGQPLLASLVLYLNPDWRRDWGGDTLCLDSDSGVGVGVAPRPRRALLMHQDVVHRLSAPSAAAGGRPRFSLVWKLALVPRRAGRGVDLARAAAWGLPTPFGSAAHMAAVKRQLAREARG
ncbi:hypothetical protein ACKKBF_B09910 [Auxenochlorella protothecoides x Auxenochlorella symbiontica]